MLVIDTCAIDIERVGQRHKQRLDSTRQATRPSIRKSESNRIESGRVGSVGRSGGRVAMMWQWHAASASPARSLTVAEVAARQRLIYRSDGKNAAPSFAATLSVRPLIVRYTSCSAQNGMEVQYSINK